MRTIGKALMLAFLFFVLGVCILSFLSPSAECDSGWQIDLFCRYGGLGENVACPVPLYAGTYIVLFANVTYNQVPVQSVLVAIQVNNPKGSPLFVTTRLTNASGCATMNFSINGNVYPTFLSKWNSTATTDPGGKTASDSMPFQVLPHLAVGGISLSIPPLATHTYTKTVFVEILIVPVLIFFAKFRKRAN